MNPEWQQACEKRKEEIGKAIDRAYRIDRHKQERKDKIGKDGAIITEGDVTSGEHEKHIYSDEGTDGG